MAKKVTKIKASEDDERLDKIEELQDQLEEELEAEDERSERIEKARERSLKLAKLGAEKLKGGAGGFMKFIREQNVVGLAVGFICLFSAIRQGQVCANGIVGMSQGHDVQTNTMIYAALPEFYAILALVATFLV